MDYVKLINCMRCGMCLPHCPTYKETFLETASPRGRVARTGISANPYASGAKRNAPSIGYY